MIGRRAARRAEERRTRSKRAAPTSTAPGVQAAINHLLRAKPTDPPDFDVERFVMVARYEAGRVQTTLHKLPELLQNLRKIGDGDIANAIEAARFPGGLMMLALANDGWRVLTVCWPVSVVKHAYEQHAQA